MHNLLIAMSSRLLLIWHKALTNLLLTLSLLCVDSIAVVLYDDGSLHSIKEAINDTVNLRSSSSLVFSNSQVVIRAPNGSESAVCLYTSSSLNMTTGEVFGGDLEGEADESQGKDNLCGVGVIVGSASKAEFRHGATVRGGNYVAESMEMAANVGALQSSTDFHSRKGGDAVVGLYFGSLITIKGGNFIGGRGTSLDGHSLHVAYEVHAEVYGGFFQGSFLARDRGAIVVHGCLSRVGNRLVGHLDEGDQVDLQIVEETGGEVIVEAPKHRESCSEYNSKSSGERIVLKSFVVIHAILVFEGLLFVISDSA